MYLPTEQIIEASRGSRFYRIRRCATYIPEFHIPCSMLRHLFTRILRLERAACFEKNYRIGCQQQNLIGISFGALRMRNTQMASVVSGPLSQDFAKNVTISDGPKDEFITEHLYYADTELCECKAKVTGARLMEFKGESRHVIILDQTVMHPQGGQLDYVYEYSA